MSITIGPVGACVLAAWTKFDLLLEGAGIENPRSAEIRDNRKAFKEEVDPVTNLKYTTVDSDILKANADKYDKSKEIYLDYLNHFIAETIFTELGYNELMNSSYGKYADSSWKPCEGGDHNCTFDCPLMGTCGSEKSIYYI